ncbi:Coq4 family protein [Acanthopleuribacter pedis]|uniref:Uncharacterized protein n=1 Tax=Acanthopleuribacter pedis TaxID=442870 RepID=A0A8J7QIT0_9BACT|nr:Coq4 family protein [Acanthopleuribacter pedis]MBO1323160.1 hypothetical protein [Acanthopleuribacter pedis]
MFHKLKTVAQMTRTMRRGEHVGDVPVLKMTLFMDQEAPSRHTDQALAMHDINFSHIDPTQLVRLPQGTFGHAYGRFMAFHQLQPFNFSSAIKPLFEKYPITIRYVRVHDMIHTLLDFDTSLAGELGVYSFVGQQHYTPTLDWAARVADRVAVLPFWQRARLKAAQARGKALAKDAAVLIAAPLETLFEQPLDEVRRAFIPCFARVSLPTAA